MPQPGARVFVVQRVLIHLWFLALVLALLPYTSDPTEPIKRLVTDGFVLLLALAGIPLAWKQGIQLRSPMTVALLLWLLVQFTAALASDYPLNSLAALRPYATLFLIYLITAQAFRTPTQAWRFFMLVILAVLLASLYGYAQHFGVDPFPWAQRDIEEYRGLPATYGNPNFAGHTLVIALVLAAGLIAAHASWWVILPAGLILGHLWLTHMRGGWVALAAAVCMAVAVPLARRVTQRSGRQAIAALCIAGIIALTGTAAGMLVLHQKSGTWAPLDSSLLLRYNSYFSASEMLLERPALGFGPGNYALEVSAYWTPYEEQWFATEGRRNTHVHNDFLEAGIDAGAPGVLLYTLILSLAILRALRLTAVPGTRGLGITLAAAFAAFAVDGIFGFNLRVPVSGGLFFALLGIVEGISLAQDRGSRVTAAILPILAAGLAAAGAMTFFGEILYQRAAGAQFWAGRFLEEGRPNDYANALASADVALAQGQQIMPWDPRFPLSQGVNDLNRAEWKAAQAHIGQAVALAPINVPALIRMAQAALNDALANSDEVSLNLAHEYALRAEALCAPLPEAQEVLGRVAFLRAGASVTAGQPASALWQEAASRLQAALRYGAENRFPLQKLLAKSYLNIEAWPEMRQALLQAAETNPADEELWRMFNTYATDAKDAQTMINALHRAMQHLLMQSPPDTGALALLSLQLASLYQGPLAQPAVAQELLSEAIRRTPGDLRLWGALVPALPAGERDDVIAVLLDGAAGQVPAFIHVLRDPAQASPELLIEAAQQLVTVARRATADRAAQELLWIAAELFDTAGPLVLSNADRAKLYAALGEVYVVAEDFQEAEPMLRAAIPELAGDERAMALALQSEALARLGRAGEGLALARQAADLAPNTWRVRWSLARRLADMGRAAEAKFEYASLLRTFRMPEDFRAMMQAELAALEERP